MLVGDARALAVIERVRIERMSPRDDASSFHVLAIVRTRRTTKTTTTTTMIALPGMAIAR